MAHLLHPGGGAVAATTAGSDARTSGLRARGYGTPGFAKYPEEEGPSPLDSRPSFSRRRVPMRWMGYVRTSTGDCPRTWLCPASAGLATPLRTISDRGYFLSLTRNLYESGVEGVGFGRTHTLNQMVATAGFYSTIRWTIMNNESDFMFCSTNALWVEH